LDNIESNEDNNSLPPNILSCHTLILRLEHVVLHWKSKQVQKPTFLAINCYTSRHFFIIPGKNTFVLKISTSDVV